MRSILTGLLSLALVLGVAATAADAKPKKKKQQQASYSRSQYYSPSVVAERQRNARTFDETQYYEVDSSRPEVTGLKVEPSLTTCVWE